MLAASAASDISPGWILRGLSGFRLELLGIDAAQFHLISPGVALRGLRRRCIRESAGIRPGKAARNAGIWTAER